MPLTVEEIGLLRDEAETWQTDVCEIHRYTSVDDAYGGRGDPTSDVVATGVTCMLESGAGHEQTLSLFGALATEAEYIVALPALTDVRVDDHLVITTQANLRLRVQAVLSPESIEIERFVIANRLLGV